MSTPVPSAPFGPLLRAVVEALESVAAREPSRAILRGALLAAGLDAIPEDADAFRRFAEGPLHEAIDRTLGAGIAEIVLEQLGHVMRVSAPTLRRQATGTGDDADDLSGERTVDLLTATPADSGVGIARPRPDVTAALRPPAESHDTPLVAPVLFPQRSTSYSSGTQARRPIARVSTPGMAAPKPRVDSRAGLEEVRAPSSGSRAVATDVLVVTLDPALVREVDTRLRGRSRVLPAASLAELMQALSRIGSSRIAIVLDTGVPSIDVPTFAGLGAAIPPGAVVVLWGTDERQKKRLVTLFPQARGWLASGAAESPADLLLDDPDR